MIGICNGAQILLEAGLVPGTGPLRRPSAAFAPNASGKFQSVHVHVQLAIAPARIPVLAGLAAGAVLPAWASHGEGRLAAPEAELDVMERDGHVAFVYCDARGERVAAPNGSARDVAGLTNRDGNVLAIMPHPERDAWTFMHRDGDPEKRRRPQQHARAMLAPSGGMVFFRGVCGRARGVGGDAMSAVVERAYVKATLTIPDNEAYTALTTLTRMGLPVDRAVRSDVWIATVDAEHAAALDRTITTIETVYNPNKHRLGCGRMPVPGPARYGSPLTTKRQRLRLRAEPSPACAGSCGARRGGCSTNAAPTSRPASSTARPNPFSVIRRFKRQYDDDDGPAVPSEIHERAGLV